MRIARLSFDTDSGTYYEPYRLFANCVQEGHGFESLVWVVRGLCTVHNNDACIYMCVYVRVYVCVCLATLPLYIYTS